MVSDDLELWYTHDAQHEVLDNARQRQVFRLLGGSGEVTGKALAERLLDDMEFDAKARNDFAKQSGHFAMSATKEHTREIDRVHQAKSAEIRATWDEPEITAQEMVGALASHTLDEWRKKNGWFGSPIDVEIPL